jgi:hypothetical protein
MNPFSSFTAGAVLRFCQGVAIVAGVLTVAALIGQTKASRVVNRQQRTDLEKFKQTSQVAIAEANERAAKLENEAEQARLELEKIRLTRFDRFNRNEFRNRIRGKPKIRVELLFQKDDVDSYILAMAVKGCLDAEDWNTIGPRPIREEDVSFSEINKDAPLSVRAGVNMGGLSYVVKQLRRYDDQNEPVNVLMSAFTAGKRGLGDTQTSTVFGGMSDPSLPEDLVKLIIGPRYRDW